MTIPTSKPGANIELDLQATNPRGFDVAEDYVLESKSGATPDLSEYQLTDPDNRVSVVDGKGYEARLSDGTNEVSRLFIVQDMKNLELNFTFEALSNKQDGEQSFIGWSDTEDAPSSDMDNFVGLRIYSEDDASPSNGFVLVDSGDPGGANSLNGFAEWSLDTAVEVVLEFDLDAGELSADVIEDGSSIGTDTISFDDTVDWDYQYAQASADGGFTVPGALDYDVTDYSLTSL